MPLTVCICREATPIGTEQMAGLAGLAGFWHSFGLTSSAKAALSFTHGENRGTDITWATPHRSGGCHRFADEGEHAAQVETHSARPSFHQTANWRSAISRGEAGGIYPRRKAGRWARGGLSTMNHDQVEISGISHPAFLRRADVCRILGISPAGLSRIQNGKQDRLRPIPCIRYGRVERFRPEAVMQWAKDHEA